jgi:uncharacterized protein (TIGR02300 family)
MAMQVNGLQIFLDKVFNTFKTREIQTKEKENSVGNLGTRYKCYKCGTKFYDLGKPQPICPSCGEDQNNEETKRMLKRKRKRSMSKVKTDIRALPEENGTLAESDDEVEEYVLDMEDIVLEENTDTEYSE